MAKVKEKPSEIVFSVVVMIILVLFCLVVLLPLIYVVSASFSDPYALMVGDVGLFPVNPMLSMYKRVFQNSEIWGSYLNTIIYTVVGTCISLVLTCSGAYPLSRPDMYGRGPIMMVFTFTMFFSGGMIPSYLLVQRLNMMNSIWAIVVPSAISTYNLIVMRTFYQQTIPNELVESASLDGYNDLQIFAKIVLPLSAPIIAVMALFYGVAMWNSWFSALLYLRDRAKYPLQMILREILIQNDSSMANAATTDNEMIGLGIRYATMVVATLPIMCLYPFLQKYFVKGVMIGAVKG